MHSLCQIDAVDQDRCVLSGSKIVFLPIYPKILTSRIPVSEPQLSMTTSWIRASCAR